MVKTKSSKVITRKKMVFGWRWSEKESMRMKGGATNSEAREEEDSLLDFFFFRNNIMVISYR